MGNLNTVPNGKGSKPRPVDKEKFNSNWDDIDWSVKKKKNDEEKSCQNKEDVE